jgi:Rrf2 family protein
MWPQRIVYAVRALVVLAAHRGQRISSARIADEGSIPHKYLESILTALRHAAIVTSSKGPTGGYTLARDPSTIHVSDVIDVLEPQWPRPTGGEVTDADALLDAIGDDVRTRVARSTIAEALMRAQQRERTIDYSI